MREGDYYIVNGQKVWTTLAHISDWYFVLVRTSNESKWGGLSLLLMDMRSPGVDIRPIRQIDGGAEFNEVFMTDVKVPVANLLGKEGQGWEVVSSALVNERSGIAGSIRGDQALDWLITTTRSQGKTKDPNVRQRIAELAIKGAIMGHGPDTPCASEQPLAPLPAPAGRATRRARCVRLAATTSTRSSWTPATRSSRSTTRWCATC